MTKEPLLIFSPQSSPRLKFTFDLIFRDILLTDYELCNNQNIFKESTRAKISYAEEPDSDEPFFYSTKLLFEKGVREQQISVFDWQDTKAFFATHPRYAFPFDPFAAAFFLASRYEEYLPHIRDQFDRFSTHESLAFEKKFLQQPVIDVWAMKIKSLIETRYPHFSFPEKKYKYISTIDIDNAYAYLEKGLMRTGGAFLRSLVHFDMKDFTMRLKVLMRTAHDPYDTYDHLLNIQKKYNLECIYFFLLGDYGENDKNVSISRKKLQSLIKSISDYSLVGIHPSFASNTQPEKLKTEISRLRKVLKREVRHSRQHFLKLTFPETYQRLIEHDITDDYTMGYAADVGFRAGTCSSFYFYDLDREVKTNLRLHPFAVMDATLKYYLKVNPENAMQYISPLIESVKKVNGTFMSLWHNESLCEKNQWLGWKFLYEEVVKAAVENEK